MEIALHSKVCQYFSLEIYLSAVTEKCHGKFSLIHGSCCLAQQSARITNISNVPCICPDREKEKPSECKVVVGDQGMNTGALTL